MYSALLCRWPCGESFQKVKDLPSGRAAYVTVQSGQYETWLSTLHGPCSFTESNHTWLPECDVTVWTCRKSDPVDRAGEQPGYCMNQRVQGIRPPSLIKCSSHVQPEAPMITKMWEWTGNILWKKIAMSGDTRGKVLAQHQPPSVSGPSLVSRTY